MDFSFTPLLVSCQQHITCNHPPSEAEDALEIVFDLGIPFTDAIASIEPNARGQHRERGRWRGFGFRFGLDHESLGGG